MGKKKNYLKYFEFTVEKARDWDWKDYVLFVIESLYQTVFPFIAGAVMVQRQELVWFFMLLLPIYFRLKIERKETRSRRKKIFVKD